MVLDGFDWFWIDQHWHGNTSSIQTRWATQNSWRISTPLGYPPMLKWYVRACLLCTWASKAWRYESLRPCLESWRTSFKAVGLKRVPYFASYKCGRCTHLPTLKVEDPSRQRSQVPSLSLCSATYNVLRRPLAGLARCTFSRTLVISYSRTYFYPHLSVHRQSAYEIVCLTGFYNQPLPRKEYICTIAVLKIF